MRRREIVAGLASAAAWPLVVRAQQRTLPVIGLLHSASPASYGRYVAEFKRALEKTGLRERQNVAIEYSWRAASY
jgi:putative tryptophan/tyrosine transport system substrate-binding protein